MGSLLEELRAQQSLPLDDVLVLIKQVLHVKTQSLAMQAHVKNMEALLQANHVPVPVQGLEQPQVPEATPQPASFENNAMDMLDQIDNIEKIEKKSMLEKSMGPGGFGNSLF